MNKLFSIMIILILIFIPISIHAFTQADLIEGSATVKIPYGLNLTKNTDYIVCIQTNKVPCVTEENMVVTYNYTYSGGNKTGSFLKLYDLFKNQGITLAPDDYFCGLISGVKNGQIKINATCNPKGGGIEKLIENITYNIRIGNMSILFSPGEYNQFVDKHFPGENITMKLQLSNISDPANPLGMGTGTSDIFYSAYNLKTGQVISGYSNRQVGENVDGWIENFTMPSTAPVGIISFNAKAGTDFGGRYIIYRSIPFKTQLNLNETAINMGESVFINLTNTIYYGNIDEINTTIKYPNGSKKNIILNSGNNYDYVFKTPTNQQGMYNVSISVKHAGGYKQFISKTFLVNKYHIDVAKLKAVYNPGEKVEISAALLDYNDNTVSSKINFTFYDIDDKKIRKYKNEETILENNYRSVYYVLPSNAKNGEYSIEVTVIDGYSITYKINETFDVSNSSQYTDVDFSAESFIINITNLNNLKKRINITNRGSAITDINISINDTNYTSINSKNLNESLKINEKTYFYLEINPKDDMPLGILKRMIKINVSEKKYEIPVTLNILLAANLKLKDKMAFELIADKLNTIKIPVENIGTYILNNLSANLSGDIKNKTDNIILPNKIHTNNTKNIEINLRKMDSGLYINSIMIKNNNLSKTMNFNITVFDDFSTDIDDIDTLRKSLHDDIIQLKKNGGFVGTVEDDIEILQAKINNLKSFYDSGNYTAAEKLLANLKTESFEIESKVLSFKSGSSQKNDSESDESIRDDSVCGDSICDFGESCSCSDCFTEIRCEEIPDENSTLKVIIVIIIIIILVVGGIVLATSIVPDDWNTKK